MVAFDIFDSFSMKHFLEDGFIFQLRWVGQKKGKPERGNPGNCGAGGNCFFKNF